MARARTIIAAVAFAALLAWPAAAQPASGDGSGEMPPPPPPGASGEGPHGDHPGPHGHDVPHGGDGGHHGPHGHPAAQLTVLEVDLLRTMLDSCQVNLEAMCSEEAAAVREAMPFGVDLPALASDSADGSEERPEMNNLDGDMNVARKLRGGRGRDGGRDGDRDEDADEDESARGQAPEVLRVLGMCMREHYDELAGDCKDTTDDFRDAMDESYGDDDCWIDGDCSSHGGRHGRHLPKWAPIVGGVVALVVVVAIVRRCRRKGRCQRRRCNSDQAQGAYREVDATATVTATPVLASVVPAPTRPSNDPNLQFVTTADGRGMWVQLGVPTVAPATATVVAPTAMATDATVPLTKA